MADHNNPGLTYERDLTGLLVVDPYNDFLSEGGKLYERSRATLEAHDVVEHMRQVLAAVRAAGVQVFIAPHHRWREADLHSRWKTMPPIAAATAKGRVFADQTWGGSFHPDFEPRPGDVVAQEHWLSSGFANTDLDLQLKKHGVRKVIVIGMRANTCIESTVRFAAELGYEVTLVKDAIGSFSHARDGRVAAVQHAVLRERDRLCRRDDREASALMARGCGRRLQAWPAAANAGGREPAWRDLTGVWPMRRWRARPRTPTLSGHSPTRFSWLPLSLPFPPHPRATPRPGSSRARLSRQTPRRCSG